MDLWWKVSGSIYAFLVICHWILEELIWLVRSLNVHEINSEWWWRCSIQGRSTQGFCQEDQDIFTHFTTNSGLGDRHATNKWLFGHFMNGKIGLPRWTRLPWWPYRSYPPGSIPLSFCLAVRCWLEDVKIPLLGGISAAPPKCCLLRWVSKVVVAMNMMGLFPMTPLVFWDGRMDTLYWKILFMQHHWRICSRKKRRNMVGVSESGKCQNCWRMSIIYLDVEPDIHQGTMNDWNHPAEMQGGWAALYCYRLGDGNQDGSVQPIWIAEQSVESRCQKILFEKVNTTFVYMMHTDIWYTITLFEMKPHQIICLKVRRTVQDSQISRDCRRMCSWE